VAGKAAPFPKDILAKMEAKATFLSQISIRKSGYFPRIVVRNRILYAREEKAEAA
jgi:hypothetical protein